MVDAIPQAVVWLSVVVDIIMLQAVVILSLGMGLQT
jgi:hypothetical protein